MNFDNVIQFITQIPDIWFYSFLGVLEAAFLIAFFVMRSDKKTSTSTDPLRNRIKHLRGESIIVKDDPALMKARKKLPATVKVRSSRSDAVALARKLEIGTGEIELALTIQQMKKNR